MDSLTYCGLLDDFSLRHDDKAIRTLPELNDHLVMAVLFGGRVLINDGYFLFHDALQAAVLDANASPLRPLIEKGYVRILTRNDGKLEYLADEMVQRGITSAQNLTAKPWYKSQYKPALEKWSDGLRSAAFDAYLNWPNFDRNKIFRCVAVTAFNSLYSSEAGYRAELDLFRSCLDGTQGRRTDWEDEAKKLEKAGRIFGGLRRLLMLTASEAYHYSWGCALGAAGHRVRVLTRLPKYLHELDSSLGEVPKKPVSPLKILVPDLNYAKKVIKNRWQILADMVSPGHKVSQRKQEFLASLEKYLVSDGISEKEVQGAAREYASALSQHFGNPEVVPVVFDLGFLAASTAAGAAVGGPVGILVGLGIGLGGVAGAHLGGPQALWKLAAPKREGWITRIPQSATDATSSFELSSDQISKFTSGAVPAT